MFLRPESLIASCPIGPAHIVVDLGAGSGALSHAVASRLHGGIVYAVEVRREMVDLIARNARLWNTPQIHALWGDIEVRGGTTLKDASVDTVLLVNTFFQLTDRIGCIQEVARILKKGGTLLFVDWTDSYGGMGPSAHHIVKKEFVIELCKKYGFTILRDSIPAGSHHYGILFTYNGI